VSYFIHYCAEHHYAQFHYAEHHHAECHNAVCCYAECYYAECHYAECLGAWKAGVFLSAINFNTNLIFAEKFHRAESTLQCSSFLVNVRHDLK
jgi:hypothetical protein